MHSEENHTHIYLDPAANGIRDFLELLGTAGPATLDYHRMPTATNIALRKLDLIWNTPLHYAVSITSDDLLKDLKSIDPALDPFTSGASLSAATLELSLEGSQIPHLVQIREPNLVECQFREDMSRVLAWLEICRTRLTPAVAKTAALLILALATALTPALGDGDSDEDDSDSDRHALAA